MNSSSEPSPAQVRVGLNAVVRDMLRPAALTLAITYFCFTVAHPFILPAASRTIMSLMAGATLLIGLAAFLYLRSVEIPARQAPLWAGAMIGLVVINLAVHICVTPEPSLTANIVVLMVASGCFVLSHTLLAATLAASFAVWIMGAVLNPAADWAGNSHMMAAGAVIAVFVYAVRRRTYRQYERVKQQLERAALRWERRLKFEQILLRISNQFLALSGEDIDQTLVEAMQAVGEALHIDHVCVCRVEGWPSTLNLVQEWCGPEAAPRKPHLQQVPTTLLPWCWKRIQADEHVQISRLEQMAEEAKADRKFLEQNGICSFFAVPLATKGQVWGVLGLTAEKSEVDWSEDAASLLRVLGEIIVASLKRKEAEDEIHGLNQKLQQASGLVGLGEMAANLAHDLGNGLSAILQFTHGADRRADRGTLTLDQCRECIRDIHEQAQYMRDILLMIQLFARSRACERVPIRLQEILKQSELLVRGTLRQKSIQLHFTESPEIPLLMADRSQITLVTVNLLLNAAQAMSQTELGNRKIWVSVHDHDPEFVEVSIKDQGRGVPTELKEKIFEKFYTTKKDGLGLGLAFSRSYIHEHGGKLWCDANENTGCDFRFTLPKSNVHA